MSEAEIFSYTPLQLFAYVELVNARLNRMYAADLYDRAVAAQGGLSEINSRIRTYARLGEPHAKS